MRRRPGAAGIALPLLVALTACTSSYRVRLDDPAALAALRAEDRTVPGLDPADRPVELRARAILEVTEPAADGLRPATVRDGRPARRLGETLILLGLGAGLAVAAAGAGNAAVEPGLALGAGVAGLGLAVALPCILGGVAAGSPVVE